MDKKILEAFIEEGNLNERQEYIMRTRVKGYLIAKQTEELHLSMNQVNKDVSEIKKYMMLLKKIVIYYLLELKIEQNYLNKNYSFFTT